MGKLKSKSTVGYEKSLDDFGPVTLNLFFRDVTGIIKKKKEIPLQLLEERQARSLGNTFQTLLALELFIQEAKLKIC